MINNTSFFKKITTAIILTTLCFSCQSTVSKKPEQINPTPQKPQPKIIYGDLVVKEQSDYLMIPVSIKDKNSNRGSFLDSSGYSEKESQFYNIIFYHKQDGKTHLLLNKKAVINSFDFIERKQTGKPTTRFWLYRIIENDTNKDDKVNSQDATIGYLSDASGKNIQQITPNNTQLISWNFVQSQGAIFIKIIKDSDNDNKFTETDKTNFLKVNLDKPEEGSEIINDQIEQEIKSYVK